jgi:hypothetical protein
MRYIFRRLSPFFVSKLCLLKRFKYFYRSFCKDQLVWLNGLNTLWVKGTEHTYKSIAQATATIVQGASYCPAILQVGSSARLVYCTNCKYVTPIELAWEVASGWICKRPISRSTRECSSKLARLTKQSSWSAFTLIIVDLGCDHFLLIQVLGDVRWPRTSFKMFSS